MEGAPGLLAVHGALQMVLPGLGDGLGILTGLRIHVPEGVSGYALHVRHDLVRLLLRLLHGRFVG